MITLKTISRAVLALSAALAAHGAMAANASVSLDTAALSSMGTITVTSLGADTFASTGATTGVLTAPISSVVASLVDFGNADGFKVKVGSYGTLSFTNFTQDLSSGILTGNLVGGGLFLSNISYAGDLIDATSIINNGAGTVTLSSYTVSAGLAAYFDSLGVDPALVPVGDIVKSMSVPVPVPEPSTYALMGLGLVGIALTARKRQAA
ncbi:MAG TPA: PEP-CTERM sorting domain-containing protein [Aquabacterium sp.]|uniref:PEP-CTERM sorting domain-containing protein n=1 Tax=Aquabacterium sp. TaxID=1872578 RepID=UPI002E33BA2E|nr:PEP-CTERM sorting domain-containing protein [Aquabacterium sp.]HEX5374086.1 PEP-CTERM sorting domain-containing protein [Aquabacterium sp.]